MQERPTSEPESLSSPIPDNSLFRTPAAVNGEGGAISEKQARERGRTVQVRDQVAQLAHENGLKVTDSIANSLLPTPALGHIRNYDEPIEDYLARRKKMEDGEYKGMPGVSLGVAVRMAVMPTPTVSDIYTANMKSSQMSEGSLHSVTLARLVNRPDLLPTPVAIEGIKATAAQGSEEKLKSGQVWLTNIAHDFATQQGLPTPPRQNGQPVKPLNEPAPLSWGKFEPAIRRWEQIRGIAAPAPTKGDGKDGSHRLSSRFTEWMMGLEPGWITDVGLSRVEELKACGNGVVPQQAELALRSLLIGTEFEPVDNSVDNLVDN